MKNEFKTFPPPFFAGQEKFNRQLNWVLIKNILEPKDYKLNGSVRWEGEEFGDVGTILIKDNDVYIG